MSFAIFIIVIIVVITTNRIWQGYIQMESDSLEVYFKEQENKLQPKIKQVYKERKDIIDAKGWVTIDDIDELIDNINRKD